MTVECPNCDAPLPPAGGCRRCAWTPTPISPPNGSHAPNVNTCARCSGTSPSCAPFHPDDEASDPQDRGVRLCPACWIPALKRRAARDPISAEDLKAGMAKIRALAARYGVEPTRIVNATAPDIRHLERAAQRVAELRAAEGKA